MSGRLSTLAAAVVVARRDFSAVLFSRSFLLFLLGPLFPLVVAGLATGVGQKVEQKAARPALGIAMQAADADAMLRAGAQLGPRLGNAAPELVVLARLEPHQRFDAESALRGGRSNVAAVVTGTLGRPVIVGPQPQLDGWAGPVALLAAQAQDHGLAAFPPVKQVPTITSSASERIGQMRTAQAAQTLLFLLTMLLAGMVLSNLVEEKANKIIEILAAAIPMDAVFLGKLFAMLAVSFVGIAVWGLSIGGLLLAGGRSLDELAAPAVGWPMFVALGTAYFAMAYLLLGSVFLTIGSMAATVRDVQTLSMPVTMLQLLVFFFASYAVALPGSTIEWAAVLIPFSSPFAMLARAAQHPDLVQHALALGWQTAWVALFVRSGARLFRRKVMKSGPAGRRGRKGLLARLRGARPQAL
ncbi:MAG: ABC transporter permease [Pseudomonadota bacterium]